MTMINKRLLHVLAVTDMSAPDFYETNRKLCLRQMKTKHIFSCKGLVLCNHKS